MIRVPRLPAWIHRFLRAGVRSGHSASLVRKIRAANAINLFLAATTVPFTLADLSFGQWFLAGFNVLSMAGYLGLIGLSELGFHAVPRLAIMFMTTGAFILGAYYFGPDVQIQTGFFAVACLPFVLFDMNEHLAIAGSFMVPMVGYFLVQMRWIPLHDPLLGRDSMFAGGHGQSFLTFVLLGLIVYHFRNANSRAETKLEAAVSELKVAMRKLEEQQQHLTQSAKMSALGEMAGGIAHEINNPLAVILLHVNAFELRLKSKSLDLDAFALSIATVKATIHKITVIINGLRFFAREGSLDPFEKITLKALIQQVLSICNQRFKDHGIRLEVTAGVFPITHEARRTSTYASS